MISIFKNYKTPQVTGTDTIEGILDKIENGFTSQNVIAARNAGKNTVEFEKYKASTITWTPNATFNGIRKRKNVANFSGYIYIDIDNIINVNTLSNLPFIYAYWVSFSGQGFGALIKVDNLNITNFDLVWAYIAEYFKKIGITVDKQTKDITRQNVISYDPNLYKNLYCNPLNADAITMNNTLQSNMNCYVSSNTGMTIFSAPTGTADIIYRTVLEDYENKDYVLIEAGKAYRSCYVPFAVPEGQRHIWLKGRIVSVLFNNPQIGFEHLLKDTLSVNKTNMKPPKPYNEVLTLVKYLYNEHLNGNIKFNPTFKKIWINPNSNLTTKQKKSIVGQANGLMRRNSAISTIQTAYDDLKQIYRKIKQKMVAEKSGFSVRTIKHYWKQIIK